MSAPWQVHFADSDELNRYMRERTGDTVVLAFSAGKDSVATWLKLRRFFRVVPVHYLILPGLSFVEDTLAYYERFFGVRIHRYPHPALMSMLDGLVFQPPRRGAVIRFIRFTRNLSVEHILADVRKQESCPTAFVGIGERASDSVMRAQAIAKWGPIRPKEETFMPIYDWHQADMLKAFKDEGVKLAVDYALFNRSFDSLRFRFLVHIKREFPEDYRRILEWFPMIEVELHRRRFAQEGVP